MAKIGRNDPCPCGSGKKFKKCCLEKTKNTEKLDRMMQKGYGLLDEGKEVEACNLWLEIWEHLKKRFTPEMKSIREAEHVFSGMQSLFNWCQDMEMALGNVGREDSTFYEKRIEYCREFYTFFPETAGLTHKSALREK